MPRMRGEQITITTESGTATLDSKIQAIENAGATDWDPNNDGRVDYARALKTPNGSPHQIEWTVEALDYHLKKLSNRAVGIAAAL